jgi:hypothetical protein
MKNALSDDLGNLSIGTAQSDGRHAGGGSSISDHGEVCAAIDVDRLQIDDLPLIQMDMDGHKLNALKDARNRIKASRPAIAIEVNNGNYTEVVAGLNYESIGTSPGLNLWVSGDNMSYRELVQSLLASSL